MRVAGITVLAGVLLVAGCGGDDDPPALPPVTAAVTTSAAATPSVSAFPETPTGAAAFARFVWNQAERAFDTGDPELLRPYYAADCQSCSARLRTLERLRDGEITVRRGKNQLLSAESPGGPGPRVVSIREKDDEVVFLDKQGKVAATEPAGEFSSEMTLVRRGDSWLLAKQVYF